MSEPELDRRIYTPQGFIRASKISDEALEAIMVLIEDGMAAGAAARKHGTSLTQFIRRVIKEPDMLPRWEAEQERHQAALQSQHGKRAANKDS